MTYEFRIEGDSVSTIVAVNIDRPMRGECFTIVDPDGSTTDYVVKIVRRKLWHPRAISPSSTENKHLEDQITQIMLVKAKDIATGKVPNPLH